MLYNVLFYYKRLNSFVLNGHMEGGTGKLYADEAGHGTGEKKSMGFGFYCVIRFSAVK